ncbi:thiol reductant ABC exporter subunit CydD [Clostridium algoriphilum]|uniref:thiol reductant ABC exporter subunit CydD n=1 Tax=Clostridium algoriphilum TaxID=198347 RepID=UPI001CF1FD4B|nr:thiol reductant ABC exporter subunit CydD [Clostridium algoriphilum]MCB2294758.1 thiol reductant ABC exporter subunit CydD [Clostridium algoriphilum]
MTMLNTRLLKESSYKKYYKPLIILEPLLMGIFIVVSAYILATIVNKVFIKKETVNRINIYLVLFLLTAVIKALVNFLIQSYIKNSAEDIKENIKEKSFKSIITGNPYKVKKKKLGEIINTLTDGAEMITPYYSQYIPQAASAVIIPMILIIVTAFIDKWSSLIMIFTYPLIPLFMILIGYKSKELNEKQWKKLSLLSFHFIDMLQGLSTLKIFERSKTQESKVFKTSENYRKATMEVLKVSFSSALVLELFSTISTAIIAVNLGLRLVYGKITFLSAFFILIITPDFYLAIRNLGLRFHSSLNGTVSIEKIDSITKELEYGDIICKSTNTCEYISEIEVKNLSYSYGDKIALNNLSFKIKKGEKFALVGEIGSGKSTLINILSGFVKPSDGMVFINGKDINYIDKEEFLSKISIASQSPYIFNKTLEANVTLGIKELNPIKLHEIYKLTKIEELKNKLEDGYQTLIGEGENVAIRGGEIQKIALARVLAKDTQLIILDEPSSALDCKSEELFTDLMNGYLKETTVLIATHRLNTLKSIHKIIVLNAGNLVEMGTHEELINNKNKYYEFVGSSEVEES